VNKGIKGAGAVRLRLPRKIVGIVV